MKRSDLHVCAAYYNHGRYSRPLQHLRDWLPRTLDAGATVHICEHTIGERPFELSKDDPNFQHVNLVQLRGGPQHEGIWLQYPLYNVLLGRIPGDAKYACWQDPDIDHQRPDWVDETLHMLQSHRVGQTWTHAIDLDPKGNVAVNDWGNEVDRSFSAAWLAGEASVITEGPYAPPVARALLPAKDERDWRAHTGFSWAARTQTIRELGRLPDWLIAGSSDYHMAHAFAGNLRALQQPQFDSGTSDYALSYHRKNLEFAAVADRAVKQDIGCVPGTITHAWHGSKLLRFYGGREDVMRESKYDPDADIAFDVFGIPYLCSDNILLRDGLRRYNRRRDSDCIRVDPYVKK